MIEYIIKNSLQEHKPIAIIYQSKGGITRRKIKVIMIAGDTVEAYCYYRHGIRKFKRENILSAAMCGA